ncbi:pyridoxamine 5'-phosphate oxidase family protein [Frankia sp. EI5c]|uniref:pyridoxamine 5'-phosphate oxidase family protein n=1 Tax=Frankia sp. EI5c TaxID=683316 RepID=UPI0008260CE1|nr:pyridoxamine 5'-phosphate oxidase family protein [Frankia sp. EI5c]
MLRPSRARLLATARHAPIPVCVTVSLLDGLVLARSAFHHSLNYRSVIIHGDAGTVGDIDEKERVLAALLRLDAESTDVALTARAGPPNDDAADLDSGYWAGVVPLRLTAGAAEPHCDLPTPTGLAPSLR